MREERLLRALSMADDQYILRAAPDAVKVKMRKKKAQMRALRFAAVLLVVLLCVGLLQTPTAAKVLEYAQKQVIKVFEKLFPPKEIEINLEGLGEEPVLHEAQGKEPEAESTGFVMYVDTERYAMTDENGTFYIRGIDGGNASLPPMEMIIEEMPEVTLEESAASIRGQMEGNWETITEILRDTEYPRISFSVLAGNEWDSAVEDHIFYENGRQGTYHITSRYFMEATEGAGSRFWAMINTFTVVDSSCYQSVSPK